MNINEIRKGVERLVVDTISPVKIDFNEDGLSDNIFVRVSNPIAITELASLGGGHFRNNCRIVVRIFSKNKAEGLSIFDSISDAFKLGETLETHNELFFNTTSVSTEFGGRDSTGSYYQLNCGIEFWVDTYI